MATSGDFYLAIDTRSNPGRVVWDNGVGAWECRTPTKAVDFDAKGDDCPAMAKSGGAA